MSDWKIVCIFLQSLRQSFRPHIAVSHALVFIYQLCKNLAAVQLFTAMLLLFLLPPCKGDH